VDESAAEGKSRDGGELPPTGKGRTEVEVTGAAAEALRI